MTIEHVFIYDSGFPLVEVITATVCGIGLLSLLGLTVGGGFEKISSRAGIISIISICLAALTAPLVASIIVRDSGPNIKEATTAWLEETHELTLVGSIPGEDAPRGPLENQIVLATDVHGNFHTIQLLPVDSNHTTLNEEPINPDNSWYLADPETGKEFTLDTTTQGNPNE